MTIPIFGVMAQSGYVAASPLSFVKETLFTETSTATTGALTPANTIGNTLLLYFAYRTTGLTINSVADTGGNTWTPIATGQAGEALYMAANTTAVSGTLTVTMSGAATLAMVCEEIAGSIGVMDKNNVATASSASPSCTTAATTHGNDIVFGFVAQQANAPTFSAQTSGFTVNTQRVSNVAATPLSVQAAYKIVAATGAQTYGLSSTSSAAWFEDVVAIKGH